MQVWPSPRGRRRGSLCMNVQCTNDRRWIAALSGLGKQNIEYGHVFHLLPSQRPRIRPAAFAHLRKIWPKRTGSINGRQENIWGRL